MSALRCYITAPMVSEDSKSDAARQALFDAQNTPFVRIGGEDSVRALVERFYDNMDQYEPELAALHQRENGRVSRASRDRFALFLIGWLGGPQDYVQRHGHPRLRMRHAPVPVNQAMRDAWLSCMRRALDHSDVDPELRSFLELRFVELAEHLRNVPG
jgi:hemoglobin